MSILTDLRTTEKLADVVGLTAALLLTAWFGNRRIYVPTSTADREHLVLKVIGDEAFEALVNHHGGEYLQVPLLDLDGLKTAGLVYRLSQKGVGADDLAELTGVCKNTIFSIRKQLRLENFPQLASLLPGDEVNHV
jgi:hypothetical protein